MKLIISRQDVIDMFSEKYPDSTVEDVVFVDDNGDILGELSECDDESDDLTFAEDFVLSTGIKQILKKALKDQGHEDRIPFNPGKICEDSADELFKKLKRSDKKLIINFMNIKGIKNFLLIWQDYHTCIHNKL